MSLRRSPVFLFREAVWLAAQTETSVSCSCCVFFMRAALQLHSFSAGFFADSRAVLVLSKIFRSIRVPFLSAMRKNISGSQ